MFKKFSYIFLAINIALFVVAIVFESKATVGFFVGAIMSISSLRALKPNKYRCEPMKDFFLSTGKGLLYQKIAMIIAMLFFIFGIFCW